MAYQLQSMLVIRGMRQDRSQTELAGARQVKAVAEREHDRKLRESEDFERDKEARRDAVYDAVMGRPVSLQDLDMARSAVTRIDEESFLRKEAESAALHVLEEKTAAAEHARIRFVAATKDLTKIQEHRKIWLEEERRLDEMRADLELEEFTGRREVADDDDALD